MNVENARMIYIVKRRKYHSRVFFSFFGERNIFTCLLQWVCSAACFRSCIRCAAAAQPFGCTSMNCYADVGLAAAVIWLLLVL
jgi:hypothetical protein